MQLGYVQKSGKWNEKCAQKEPKIYLRYGALIFNFISFSSSFFYRSLSWKSGPESTKITLQQQRQASAAAVSVLLVALNLDYLTIFTTKDGNYLSPRLYVLPVQQWTAGAMSVHAVEDGLKPTQPADVCVNPSMEMSTNSPHATSAGVDGKR